MHGCRKNHNVITAKIDIDEEINLHKDNGRKVAILSTDLSAAYNTVNHLLLLNKFKHIGILGKALSLFTSFLEDRNFFVEVQGFNSQTHVLPEMSLSGYKIFWTVFHIIYTR